MQGCFKNYSLFILFSLLISCGGGGSNNLPGEAAADTLPHQEQEDTLLVG